VKGFATLLRALDEPGGAARRETALADYFASATPAEASWVLWLLAGGRPPRVLSATALRDAAARAAGVTPWLVDESRRVTGELGEAAALVLPRASSSTAWTLDALLTTRHDELALATPVEREARLVATWRELDEDERVAWNRILLGTFRTRVPHAVLARAVARVLGCEPTRVARLLASAWRPSAAVWSDLCAAEASEGPLRPLPLALASSLDDPATAGVDLTVVRVEWEWEGERAQLARLDGETLLWSAAEELLGARAPEVIAAAAELPGGTVLDGTLLAWRDGRPLAPALLAQRLRSEQPTAKARREAPLAFVAHDALRWRGEDLRATPLRARDEALHAILDAVSDSPHVLATAELAPASWDAAAALRASAREHGARGLLLRAWDAPYPADAMPAPSWWRWPAPALAVRTLLLYAERGGGGRGSSYSQLTLAVRDGDELVPVAKLAAALAEDELLALDRWVRRNIVAAFGPVRQVRPELVFELEAVAVRASERHKAGLVLVEARIARWRRDVEARDADTLASLRRMLPP